jgi:hypothetical protein
MTATDFGQSKSLVNTLIPTRAGYRFVAFAMLRNSLRSADRALRGRKRPHLATVAPSSVPNGTYYPIYPAENFTLTRPESFSEQDWRVFQLRNVERIPESFVLDLPGASVVGQEAWIRDAAGAFVEGIWSERGFGLAASIPAHLLAQNAPARHLAGTTACLAMPWLPNYYHWTLQAVPRFHLLRQVIDPAAIDHWIVPAPLPRYMRDWLDLLNITEEKRVPVIDGAITCDRLLAPSIPAPNRWLPAWLVRYLQAETAATVPPPDTGRRLYIARDPGEKRRILNQDALDMLLARADIEVVSMSGRSIRDQMALFAGASLIVSVLGAALTNLVYCRPGTRVVEILPKNLTFPAYYKLAVAAGLDYHATIGLEPRVPGSFYRTDPSADVIANIPALENLLGV